MELLQKTYEKFGFSPEEVKDVVSHFHPQSFKKGEYILKEGDYCKRIVFVLKGCSRAYFSDADLREKILYFGFEGWWLGDVESFFNNIPARLSVQALEDHETAVIHLEDFYKLVEKYPKFREGYMQLLRNSLAAMIRRVTEEQLTPVEERYKMIMEKQPNIIQRVPLKQIALYLGIAPESLSRIRKRLLGK